MSLAPNANRTVSRHVTFNTSAQWEPRHNRWLIAVSVTLATFMEVLDTSIANVALPHIAGGLGATLDESTWILTAYLAANAIVLPLSAWLSVMFGRKRLYMGCVALFGLSSVACGMAKSLRELILFRIMQGAGGGGLGPSEQGILADTFLPAERGMAFAIYGMAIILAPAIGPALGGWITDNYTWRWLFVINVPAGLLSLLLTYHLIEDPPYLVFQRKLNWRRTVHIDIVGLVLVATFLGPLQIMLDRGEEANWLGSPLIVTLAIVWIVSLAALIVWEWSHPRPVVNLKLFRNRTFAISFLLMFILGFILYGSIILLPQYVQMLMSWSAQRAGMVLTPGGFTLMLLMPIVGLMIARFDARWVIALGFAICAAALYHMTIIDPEIDYFHTMMLRVYMAAGVSLLFVPISTIAYTDVAKDHNDEVSSMINLARNVGGSIGIAMSFAIVIERSQFHHANLVVHATNYSDTFRTFAGQLTIQLHHRGLSQSQALSQAYRRLYHILQAQAQTLGYIDAFYLMACLSLCMIPLCALMKRNDPKRAMFVG